ncbi:sarcosine oxidase subunit gamma [Fluviibacterium sp. DFM31]|uniref:Sarcosine oxidase subunit gamma n=1 Tax=Meridianimarinicoccus marinus TaxID=3231483 RepID=A0ABV3L9K0_9RHOB
MTDLAPATAFGVAEPREQSFGTLSLRERPDLALASLALAEDPAPLPQPFGVTLPEPGRMALGDGGLAAVWMAPRQWMLLGEGAADDDFAACVVTAVPEACVTEQTDGWVAIDLQSDDGAAPLARLLERMVNLRPEALTAGCATRTLLAHQSVFVLRRAEDLVTFLGPRSAAGSLWHAVATAAQRLQG